MEIDFQVSGIQEQEWQALWNQKNEDSLFVGVQRMIVDAKPGYPCRKSLVDAEIGEEVLLFTYEHHRADSPYRASGPVFVRTNAPTARLKKNEIPLMLRHRLLSLRGYDEQAMMIEACTAQGEQIEKHIHKIFANSNVQYIQVHNASPGCYNCQINRA